MNLMSTLLLVYCCQFTMNMRLFVTLMCWLTDMGTRWVVQLSHFFGVFRLRVCHVRLTLTKLEFSRPHWISQDVLWWDRLDTYKAFVRTKNRWLVTLDECPWKSKLSLPRGSAVAKTHHLRTYYTMCVRPYKASMTQLSKLPIWRRPLGVFLGRRR